MCAKMRRVECAAQKSYANVLCRKQFFFGYGFFHLCHRYISMTGFSLALLYITKVEPIALTGSAPSLLAIIEQVILQFTSEF